MTADQLRDLQRQHVAFWRNRAGEQAHNRKAGGGALDRARNNRRARRRSNQIRRQAVADRAGVR